MASEIPRSNVNHTGGIEAGEKQKITSFVEYLGDLRALVRRPLSSTELKLTYLSLTAGFKEYGSIRSKEDMDAVLQAQQGALGAIARAEAKERGLAVPSNSVIAQMFAEALDRAFHDQNTWLKRGTEVIVAKIEPRRIELQLRDPFGGMTDEERSSDSLFARRTSRRRPAGATGTLLEPIPGRDGVWQVQFPDGEIAAYSAHELRPKTGRESPKKD
jgi:hypothetical protein